MPEPRTPTPPEVPEPRTPPQAAIKPEPAPAEPQQEEAEPEPTVEATASGDPATEPKPEPIRGSEGGARLQRGRAAATGRSSRGCVVGLRPGPSRPDRGQPRPEAPTSPAEEASAATADERVDPSGKPRRLDPRLYYRVIESLGVSEGSRDGYPVVECDDTAADGGSGGPAAC